LQEIAARGYEMKREDWAELILAKIYDSKNPEEKINFQNIKSIEGIFKGYFSITIDIQRIFEQKIHLYHQIRHVILHNNSKIDERFISNVNKAGINITPNSLGNRVVMTSSEFNDCKEVFKQFFIDLEQSLPSGTTTNQKYDENS
jgi:hypothetical protein